jgi:hypothetical protein
VVLAYLPYRRRLTEGETPSSSTSGAPDCRRNRQNRIIQFAKPDSPVFPILSRGFRLLSDSCGNNGWDNEASTWHAPASAAPTGVKLFQIKSLETSTKLCLIYAKKKISKNSLVPPPPYARSCPNLCRIVLLLARHHHPTTLSSPSCRFTESIVMRLRYLV